MSKSKGRKPFLKSSHKLDSYELRVTFDRSGRRLLSATGRSDLQRPALWVWSEEFDEESPYGVSDAIHHLALVVEQDRPNTRERLFFGLNGGLGWVEEQLPGFEG